jgi:hypothetical protein
MSAFVWQMIAPLLLAYPCPERVFQDQDAQKSVAWLKRFQGLHSLHGCRLEIQVCDPEQGQSANAPLGEILLVTSAGEELYVRMELPPTVDPQLAVKVKAHKRAFTYRSRDKYYEETSGRQEFTQVELQTQWDELNELKQIELGLYSSTTRLNQPNGNQSHWFRCGPT